MLADEASLADELLRAHTVAMIALICRLLKSGQIWDGTVGGVFDGTAGMTFWWGDTRARIERQRVCIHYTST